MSGAVVFAGRAHADAATDADWPAPPNLEQRERRAAHAYSRDTGSSDVNGTIGADANEHKPSGSYGAIFGDTQHESAGDRASASTAATVRTDYVKSLRRAEPHLLAK